MQLYLLLAIALCFVGCGAGKQAERGYLNSASQEIAIREENIYPGCTINAYVPGSKDNFSWSFEIRGQEIEHDGGTCTLPTNTECELVITAKSGAKKYTRTLYISTLPVLYLEVPKNIGDDYTEGFITMSGSESYQIGEGTGFAGDMEIKLRGNSTRNREKHPYRIKLDKKADLFSMGKSKNWVLLADDIDHTLSRNKIVLDFARAIGIETASECTSVVLMLNGEYRGVYLLCEPVKLAKTGVDIFSWEDMADDIAEAMVEAMELKDEEKKPKKAAIVKALTENYSWIEGTHRFTFEDKTYVLSQYADIPDFTGGFLLEMDFYNIWTPVPDSVTTLCQQPWYVNTPEGINTSPESLSYIKKYLQTFEYALRSRDFKYHQTAYKYALKGTYFDWRTGWKYESKDVTYRDPARDGMRYDQLFDMDSLVTNFLVCEFSRNWDCMKNSVFCYKDLNEPAKLAPVWDFDWAFGNANMYRIDTYYPTGWQTTDQYFTNEQFYQSQNWNRYLIQDPVFVQALFDKWQQIRPTVIEDIIKKDGLLDQRYAEMSGPAAANDNKWKHTYREYDGQTFVPAWKAMSSFIKQRIAWLDQQFTDADTLYDSLNSYIQGEDWWGK